MMRRLLALLALVAAPLAAQNPYTDSLLTAAGCVTTSSPALSEGRVLLDSGGIKVVQTMQSSGTLTVGAPTRWCPANVTILQFPRDTVWLIDSRPFVRHSSGEMGISLIVRALKDSANWRDIPYSPELTALVNFSYPSWRAAVAVLAPAPGLPPVVIAPPGAVPPVAVPPIAAPPATERCTAPSAWLGVGNDKRRDDVLVGDCVALVTLASTTRWRVMWPSCGIGKAWRAHPTLYVTRTSAVLRARKVPACAASGLSR